jgi:hypothetical protein
MGKYVKKPIVIEAHQWFKNGDHPLDYSKEHDGLRDGVMSVFTPEERKANNWEGDIVRYFRHPDIPGDCKCEICGVTMHNHGYIETQTGGNIVCPGDYVVETHSGWYGAIKKDIFEATYDKVTEDEQTV